MAVRRKFILNLLLLVFLNLLVKPFYILGIDTEVINRVGQSTYGLYFALLNLSFLTNIFLDMGLVNFNTNHIAKNEHLLSKHFLKLTSLRLVLSASYIIVSFVIAIILGYRGMELKLLLPLCVNQVLVGLILFFRSNLAGLQLFARDSLVSVTDRLLLIVMCSWVLWFSSSDLEMTIELFITLQMIAYSLTALIAFRLVRKKIKPFKRKFSRAFSYMILKKSIPYALLVLLMGIYTRTDAVMLERLLPDGQQQAGIYAQAYRFYEAGNMIAFLFGALLFPMFARELKNRTETKTLLETGFSLLFILSITACFIGVIIPEEIMSLRYESMIESSAASFKYLMIGFAGVTGTYVFGALLTANESLRYLNIMATTGVALNVILNFLLIPEMKAEGAAMASMITQLSMAIWQFYLVRKVMGYSISNKTLFKALIFTLIMGSSIYWITLISTHWLIIMGVMILLAVISSLVVRLISIQSIGHYSKMIGTSSGRKNLQN